MFSKGNIKRLAKYSGTGALTFLIDIALLYILVDIFHFHVLASTATAFIVAVSAHYAANRLWIFQDTERGNAATYALFLSVAISGSLIVTFLMWVFVFIFDLHYAGARVLIALLSGFWSYPLNYYVTFRPHQHKKQAASNTIEEEEG